MGKRIRLAHPWVPAGVLERMGSVLESGMLISGSGVRAFEEGIARHVGERCVVAVSSGTTASYLAFLYWRSKGYRSVVMPAFSFPSVASAAMLAGLEVRLADIEPERLALRPSVLGEVDERTLVMTVDSFGLPAFLEEWREWGKATGGVWLEDAACGLGSHEGALRCGEVCRMAFLSFHPRKVLTTGEGGALVCSSEDADGLRMLRNLGMEVVEGERRFVTCGVNARMSELHAALGLGQLEMLPEMLKVRRKLGKRYLELLDGVAGVSVPKGYRMEGVNFQSMVVRLEDPGERMQVIARLAYAGIESTVAGFALPAEQAFSGLSLDGDVSESLRLGADGLALPLHERMSVGDVEEVVGVLAEALGRGA